MIRLAVISDDAFWREVGARLPGAAIETSVDVFAIRALDECDAVVLMGDGACSADAIQSLRNSRKRKI